MNGPNAGYLVRAHLTESVTSLTTASGLRNTGGGAQVGKPMIPVTVGAHRCARLCKQSAWSFQWMSVRSYTTCGNYGQSFMTDCIFIWHHSGWWLQACSYHFNTTHSDSEFCNNQTDISLSSVWKLRFPLRPTGSHVVTPDSNLYNMKKYNWIRGEKRGGPAPKACQDSHPFTQQMRRFFWSSESAFSFKWASRKKKTHKQKKHGLSLPLVQCCLPCTASSYAHILY